MKYLQTNPGERKAYRTPSLRTLPVQFAEDLLVGSVGLPDIIDDDEIDW